MDLPLEGGDAGLTWDLGEEVSLRNGSARFTVVAARGEIDALTVGPFAETLSEAAGKAEGSLLVDLEKVDFIDAKGFVAVLNAERKMRARGGEVLVVCSRSTTRRIFTLLDPHRRLRLCP
jgi:anti-anti-sigma factor